MNLDLSLWNLLYIWRVQCGILIQVTQFCNGKDISEIQRANEVEHEMQGQAISAFVSKR